MVFRKPRRSKSFQVEAGIIHVAESLGEHTSARGAGDEHLGQDCLFLSHPAFFATQAFGQQEITDLMVALFYPPCLSSHFAIPLLPPLYDTLRARRHVTTCDVLATQVDLALYGHHHSYQRTCKVANEVCTGMSSEIPTEQNKGYTAPVHVVMGMAGMGLSQNMVSPSPEWVEYATDREFGLGMIVADSSKLQLSFLMDGDGQVGDEVVLVRPSSQSSSSEAGDAPAEIERIGVAVDGRRVEPSALRDRVEGAPDRKKEIGKKIREGRARRSKFMG